MIKVDKAEGVRLVTDYPADSPEAASKRAVRAMRRLKEAYPEAYVRLLQGLSEK